MLEYFVDTATLKAIRADVERANKPKKSAPKQDNSLYNACMGLYREFLAKKGSYLDMTGRKAVINATSMRGIIDYIRGFQKANNKPYNDIDVKAGWALILANWDKLNDYHKRRVKLPDIKSSIEEIIIIIRNGHDKASSTKSELETRLASLRNQKR